MSRSQRTMSNLRRLQWMPTRQMRPTNLESKLGEAGVARSCWNRYEVASYSFVSLGHFMRSYFERLAQAGSDYTNAVLGTDWGTKADQWLREVVSAKATAASKAMDAEYLRTHIG